MRKSNFLAYKGYFGRIEFDAEAKIFYGRVINTRDTITFQSDYAHQLEQEFQKSVNTYIDFCQELGESPEKPFSGEFRLQFPQEDYHTIALAAQFSDKKIDTWIIEHLIECAHKEIETYQN